MGKENPFSESVLSRVVARSFRFLVGLARSPRLLVTMRTRGFTSEVQAEGWGLIDQIAGRGKPVPVVLNPVNETIEHAIARTDVWVTTHVPIIKATLLRRFPAQHTYLFADGLGVAHGPDAVRVAGTLVARFEAMAGSAERADSRDDDAAALALLATRGVTAEGLAQVAARVRTVQRATAASATPAAAPQSLPPPEADPRAALYVWFSEWSEIARAVLVRRADQIKLGLASPRRRAAAASADEDGADEDADATDEGESEEVDTAADEAAAAPEPVAAAEKTDAPARAPAKAEPAARRAPKSVPRGTPSSAPSPN